MEIAERLDNLTHDEIRDWLRRSLHGIEVLPVAEPGEPPHLAVRRLSKRVKPQTRQSLRDGCIALIRESGEDGGGDPYYLVELLGLATQFETLEIIPTLANLARRFPQLDLPEVVRLAVLAALVDIDSPRSTEFWDEILDQDPRLYAGRAFSGLMQINPAEAIGRLPRLPDDEALGPIMRRKVAFAWMEMTPGQRGLFVEGVRGILASCQTRIADALRSWVETRDKADVAMAAPASARSKNEDLAAAIFLVLGAESAPKVTSPKLVQSLGDAA